MHSLQGILRLLCRSCATNFAVHRQYLRTSSQRAGDPGSTSQTLPSVAEQIDMLYSNEPPIPEYHPRENEPVELQRARLLYQSRKRGMLENGLLLSAFADRFLHKLSPDQLRTYDNLINLPSNDWEIYYWIVGVKPVPPEFRSDVMTMLTEFARNEKKESRIRQPDLNNGVR